jgi:fructokinase
MTKPVYLAAVEGGGTTFLASIALIIPSTDTDDTANTFAIGPTTLRIIQTATFPPNHESWTPSQILSAISQFFTSHRPIDGYSSLGIATFGPAGVDPNSSSYGCILSGCPKKEWRNVDLLSPLKKACQVENNVGFDTDVNAPALAEFRHRCHLSANNSRKNNKPLTSLAYITIGTGVGVGLVINSQPVHGLLHPEGGHVPIHTLPNDEFQGYTWGKERSPFGGVGTVEGVTSSVALTERWMQQHNGKHRGQRDHSKDVNQSSTRSILSSIPDNDELWSHASNAISNLCTTILLLTSCQVIVLGGGIMNRSILLDRIRKETLGLLNGYLDVEELCEDRIHEVICESSWREVGSGLVGAFALALDCLDDDVSNTVRGKKEKKADGKQFGYGMMVSIAVCLGCLLLSRTSLRR